MAKYMTVENEREATLSDWIACYGYLLQDDRRWLIGLPAYERACRRHVDNFPTSCREVQHVAQVAA